MSQNASQLEAVLAERTDYLVTVVEDLYQPHNGAAVIRACECYGVQNLYSIQRRNPFRVSVEIVDGADRFVDVHHFNQENQDNTTACLQSLKAKGYRIFATSLRPGCIPISEVPLDQPLAICFGTEMRGLSETAHELADAFVRLPMYGFTQSFNISVSSALAMHELTTRLRTEERPWQLKPERAEHIRQRWTNL